MKKSRKTVKAKASKSPVRSARTVKYNPHSSPIIQGAIVFLMVAAIVLVAYVFKNFTP